MGHGTGAARRRSLRDRLVDGLVVAIAVLWGPMIMISRIRDPIGSADWVLHVDQGAGVVGCLALWWRRRRPVPVACGLVVVSTFAESVALALALFTTAVHRPARTALPLLGACIVTLPVFRLLRPEFDDQTLTVVTLGIVVPAAAVGWGMAVRSRRQLVASLRERAAAAEVEARLRADRVTHEARETLAREMHDVLGHRLSLLSVHAGALAHHRTASEQDVARAVEVIRDNAHRALQDLREVIGVLRAPVGETPLPSVCDVGDLVTEADRAGTTATLVDDAGVTTDRRSVPETVVQEGLTNVRKHAPAAPVVVRITGRAGDHLAAEIVNEPSATPATVPDGPPGAGLRGLTERAALVGGRLDHGPTDGGGRRVAVRLPWPS